MSNFWDYEYIPEIAVPGIPRELQRQAYENWKKTKNKRAMSNLIRTFGKLINSEIGRYQGTLPRPVLASFAKKFVTDAVKSYKPQSGNQLSTHIVNNLQRLHRINYKNVQGLKSSESIQSKMNTFFQIKNDLQDELGREPSSFEIAEKWSVPIKFIEKMNKGIRFEKEPGDEQTSHILLDNIDEREVADFLYFELPQIHKKIFEHKTGYLGAPVLSNTKIAKKLNISPVRVTQIGKQISDKFNKAIKARK